MEYEADGHFWIEDEDMAVRGHLRFTQADGGELRLEGILGPPGVTSATASVDLIRGRTLGGTELCLLDTFPTQPPLPGARLPVYPHRYLVNQVLVRLDDPNRRLPVARVAIHGLLDFLDQSGLAVEGTRPGPDVPVAVSWRPEENLPIAKVEGIEVTLVTEHRLDVDDYRATVEHRVEFELRHADGLPMLDWVARTSQIEGLVAFLTGYPAWVERLYAPAGEDVVDYIARRRIIGRDAAAQSDRPWITLDVIRDDFQGVVAGWFRLFDSDHAAYLQLAEYLLFGGEMLLQDRLLTLARFIELYHRGRFEQVVIPKREHRERIAEILDAVPDAHREWLKNALGRSNEKTLRERIIDLIGSFGETLLPLADGDAEAFAARITDNRNFYTHFSDSVRKGGRVVDGVDLFYLGRRLFMLVRGCVLREMRFADQAVAELLIRDRRLQNELARASLRRARE